MRKVFLVSIAAFCLGSPSYSNADLYSDGVACYRKGEYRHALQDFNAVCEKEPGNTSAIYYAAHCNLALGNRSTAIRLYKFLVKEHPASAEAEPSRQVLHRLHADVPEQSTSAPSPPKDTNISGDKKVLITQLVKTVRAQANRPEVSASLVTEMKETLQGYPVGILQLLVQKNCKIFLTPTLIDKQPELVHTKPSGYEEGTTYRNCPGCFSDGEIIICEYTFIGDYDDLRAQKDTVSTLRHEIGHALDYCLGGYSTTTAFKHAHALDAGSMDEDAKPQLAYYLQKDISGPIETFAELVCAKLGGGKARAKSTAVETKFTRCSDLVDKVLAKYEKTVGTTLL